MRTQYSYNPPPSGTSDWILKLKPLIEPPTCYATYVVLLGLGAYLAIMGPANLQKYGYYLMVLLIAFPIHELSHALVATYLGDSTPRYHGHLTPNPFAQLNLMGSVLMLFIGIGWAYVPISPSNLRPNPRIGHMIVAAAGPIANLLLGVVLALLWHLMVSPLLIVMGSFELQMNVQWLFLNVVRINFILFFFNLLPFAPLDGFFVLKGLLPYEAAVQLEKIQPYSMFIFIGIMILEFTGIFPIFSLLIGTPAFYLTSLLF